MYCVQYNNNLTHTTVKMSCVTTNFPALICFSHHVRPLGIGGLSKYYHLRLNPKLVHWKCTIRLILLHVLHVPTFWTIPGPLVCPTFNNHNTNMLLTAHNGLCWDPLTTGKLFNSPIKIHQVSTLMPLIRLSLMESVIIWNHWWIQVNMVLQIKYITTMVYYVVRYRYDYFIFQ